MAQEIITNYAVKAFLRSYLTTLTGSELVALRKDIASSSRIEELPTQLREGLHLKNYLLKRDLHKLISEEFEILVPERCLLPGLLSPEELKWIASFLKDTHQRYLEYAKASAVSDRPVPMPRQRLPGNVPGVVKEYAKFLQDGWLQTNDICVKMDDNEKLQIVVNAPVITISSIQQELQKMLKVLDHRPKNVLLIADWGVYIDTSLSNVSWHGTDIMILTKRLECFSSHTWDISGQGYCENGGNFAAICEEYAGLDKFSVVTKAYASSSIKGNELSTIEMLLRLFPPSASSDSLRKLVAQNALSIGGAVTTLCCDPRTAIDIQGKKVIKDLNEFYIEGELHNELKYFVGFCKDGSRQGTSFCLIQDNQTKRHGSKNGAGKSGVVAFASINDPLTPLSYENIGFTVTSEDSNGCGIKKRRSQGRDVGYFQSSAKDITKYPPGAYELMIEDYGKDKSAFHKLLRNGASMRIRIVEKENVAAEPLQQQLDLSQETLLASVVSGYEHLISRLKTKTTFLDDSIQSRGSRWWIERILQ